MSIARRILLAFGFVMAIQTGQSIMGFLSAGQSSALVHRVASIAHDRANLAITLQDAIWREERHTQILIAETAVEQKAALSQLIAKADKDYNLTVAALLKANDDKSVQQQLTSLTTLTHDERALRNAIINLTANQPIQAHADLQAKLLPVWRQRQASLLALSKSQESSLSKGFDAIAAVADEARIATALSALLSILVALGTGVWLYRSISRPLNEAITIANQVADGDLTSHIKSGGDTEIGRLLRALQRMSDRTREAVGSILSSSESVMVSSVEIAEGNADLSRRTEQEGTSLQLAGASMASISDSLARNTRSAIQARDLAAEAAQVAADSGQRIDGIVTTMQNIAQSSQRMSDIVSVIDGIAFQTNILALNAAVESARAGEQGKGFAVVAGEVRSLAQRSAEAAGEIKRLISSNEGTVSAGVNLVREAGERILSLVESSEQVASAVAAITNTTAEQAHGIKAIETAFTHIERSVQQNSALVEESAAAAESLKHQTQALHEAVGQFKLA